jgi:hypothetical protein
MRRGAAGLAASLGLALALSCAPAAVAAKHHPRPLFGELPTRVAGSVTIAWHGDPARGCAAAGVCDIRGTLTYTPGQPFFQVLKLPHGGFEPQELQLVDLLAPPAVVRVRRDPPGAAPSMCVDTVSVPFLLLSPTSLAGGRFRYDFSDALLSQAGLSAGRCAGPVPSDLRGKLPSGVLDMRALRHGSELMNMSSRQPFASGPFSGETVSTLGVRVDALSRFRSDESNGSVVGRPRPRRRVVRLLQLDLTYRSAGFGGSLETSFSGVDGPLCAGLDACGASGTIGYTPAGVRAQVVVLAQRRLRTGEHPTPRTALADLRAGRLRVFGFAGSAPDAVARVSSTLSRPGDATCTDSVTTAFPGLDVSAVSRSLGLRLGASDEQGDTDWLRTRCPGPAQSDILAGGALAVGQIGLAALGKRALTVRLSRPGAFVSGAYRGTRSGALTLRLARRTVRESVRRVRVAR